EEDSGNSGGRRMTENSEDGSIIRKMACDEDNQLMHLCF
nr:hypothetical protein [Tanacetum cinerariifolium]